MRTCPAIASRWWRPPVALVLVILLAAALRFLYLDAIPPGFHYDEALEALEAWRVLTRPGYHPIYFPGDFGLAPLFIYLDSLAFRLLPALPSVPRGIAAVIGTLTVPAVYGLGRELRLADDRVPPGTPLLAAATLAILPWHITFSRVGIEPILVPLFLVLVIWTLLNGLRTNRWITWFGLGTALGLSVYTYPAAWLLPPLVICIVAYLWLTSRDRLAGRGRGLILAGVIATLVAAPLILHFVQYPGQVLLRSSQVAAVGTGRRANAALAAIASNLVKALGMFSFAGDTDPRSNIPGMPVLNPLLSIPFCLGVMLAFWRWKRPATAILLLAAGFMLAVTVFSEHAPNFRRSLGMTPIIALFCGLGLATLLGSSCDSSAASQPSAGENSPAEGSRCGRAAMRFRRLRHWAGAAAVLLILSASAILGASAYFDRWAHSPSLFYAYDEGLWQIGDYVKSLPSGEAIYVTPRPAIDATLAFAWREGPPVRHFDGRHALILPPADREATYVVIEHEDFRGAGLLASLYGDAVEDRVFLDRDGKVYARALQIPAGAVPARPPANAAQGSWPGIELIGYDLDRATYHPGNIVYLQIWWRATAKVSSDWTVFTHLLGPPKTDGSILWAGKDARPGQGSIPTTAWLPGDVILDEYQIQLPDDVPPGEYPIEVGLYDPVRGGARAITTEPPGSDHLILGTVRVEQ
jgi:hypothetical protein